MISVIIVNSREDCHSDWVQLAKDSVKKQTVECELIGIDNIGRKKTIGKCFNEGVKKAKYDLVLFLGDDDWITADYCSVLLQYSLSHPNYVQYTTNMTVFDEETKQYTNMIRVCTGMWRKDYLLKYPFNENLRKGIDREYIEEMKKRGDRGFTVNHHHGYYYRKHKDYSSSGKVIFNQGTTDMYILTSGRNFIDPLISRWSSVFATSEKFDPIRADNAKIIWCEWLRQEAIEASKYECKAKKILRLHAYEAFSSLIYYVDFKKFDLVIFIAKHIKDFVESKVGKIPNAVVIPVGISINGFNPQNKIKNHKIAYAGEISRKKGIGELLFIANSLPEYEFYIAGKFNEEDVARHLNEKQPKNVHIEPYSYDLPKFFEDKTYYINTSLREGNPVTVLQAMACGLRPLIYDWVGAKEIYGDNVFKNLNELKSLLKQPCEPKKYKEFVKRNYDFETTYKQIEELLNNVISN